MHKRKHTSTKEGKVRNKYRSSYLHQEKYEKARYSLPITFGKFGDQGVRRFRRAFPDLSLYGAGSGIIQASNADGLSIAYFSIGSTSTDLPSAPTLYQAGISFTYSLNSIINPLEITNLFNQYRIIKAVHRFSMDNAAAYTAGSNPNPSTCPSVYLAYDPNDGTPPAASSTMLQYGDVQVKEFRDKEFWITVYPRPAVAVYNSLTATGYAQPTNNGTLWMDTATPSQANPHYGLKGFLRNFQTASGVGLVLRINTWLYFECKQLR